MDLEVKQPLPQGNALFGFAAKKRSPRLKLGLIAISVLILAGAAFGIVGYSAIREIPLPKNSAVLLTVRGQSRLPESLPKIWRQAAKASRLPVVLGLTRDSGKLHAFAILDRFDKFDAPNVRLSKLWKVYSDESLELDGTGATAQPKSTFTSLILHQAFLSIDGQLLFGSEAPIISGPIDGSVWRTDTQLPKSEDVTSIVPGDIFVDFTAFPEAWPSVEQGLKRNAGLEIDETPSAISLDMTSGTLSGSSISFQRPPADKTILALAGSIGIFDLVPYALPDGSMVLELKLPNQVLGQTLGKIEPEKWKNLTVTEGNISVRSSQMPLLTAEPSCAPGKLVLKLSKSAIQPVLKSLNLDSGVHSDVNGQTFSLELHNESGKLNICLK